MFPYANQLEFATKTICKNVIKKLVNIALHLNESMIILKENKIEFYRTKLLKLVHIYIIIFIKKKI